SVLFAIFANDGHIGDVDRRFFLDDPAFNVALWIRTGVPLDHLHTFDNNLLIFRPDDQNTSRLAAILSAQNVNFIIFLDWRKCRHQITSGASETIFINLLSRSSRATGPNTRVPTGS